MSASYTKLKSGDWGVRVQGEAQPGKTVTVTRKDGGTKTETIDKVLWAKDGIMLCSIKATPRPRTSGRDYPGKMCPCCGSEPLNDSLYCWECGYTGSR